MLNKIIDWFSNLGTNENNGGDNFSEDESLVFYTSTSDVEGMFEEDGEATCLICYPLSDEDCQESSFYTKIKVTRIKADSDEE